MLGVQPGRGGRSLNLGHPKGAHGIVPFPGVMKGPHLVLLVLLLCSELCECQDTRGTWPKGMGGNAL